jgi:hypothetical protein
MNGTTTASRAGFKRRSTDAVVDERGRVCLSVCGRGDATAGGPQKGPPITMSTMKFERRPEAGAEPSERQEPEAVVDRLAGCCPSGRSRTR